MKHKIQVLAFLVTLLALSCSKTPGPNSAKSSSNANFTGCRVMQISGTGMDIFAVGTYKFTYNNDGTVATILNIPNQPGDSFLNTFSYHPNYIIGYMTDNGASYSRDSMVLDNQNRVIWIDHYVYNGSPLPHEMYDTYQYDSLGNMVYHMNYYYSTVTTQNFQWQNGNVLWNTIGTGFDTYLYDTVTYNIGNINARITDLEQYGRCIYTTKDLRSLAIVNGSDTVNYVYTLDDKGKITTLLEEQPYNMNTTVSITYTCD